MRVLNGGIVLQFNNVRKEVKKMGLIPSDIWNISEKDTNVKWHIYLSERSLGKTTTLLLHGLVAYRDYGTIIHYVRTSSNEITKKTVENIFNTIIKCGYIEKIFDNKWNDVIYKSQIKKWYLARRDEEGKIIDVDTNYIMFAMSLDKNFDYKSSYSCDKADFVIFDEFINNYYRRNDFVLFCDLLSTLRRKRDTMQIFMLSNTIDKESEYFDEMELREFIESSNIGDRAYIQASKGAQMYIELATMTKSDKQKKINADYFGFDNPALYSITGEGWSTSNYPHINFDEVSYYKTRIFVKCTSGYIQLELAYTPTIGLIVLVHDCNEPSGDDCIIYTNGEITKINERFKFGNHTKLDLLIWNNLYNNNRFFYANNYIGSRLNNYIKISKRL